MRPLVIYALIMCAGQIFAQHTGHITFNNISVRDDDFVGYYYTTACEDDFGFMWFAGRRGLVRYDGITFQSLNDHFRFDEVGTHIVFRLLQASDGDIWMTNANSVYRIDPATLQYVVYDFRKYAANTIVNPDLESIHQDRQGRIWVSGRNGLYQYRPAANGFKHYRYVDVDHFAANGIVDITQDYYRDHLLWLGTNSGGLPGPRPAARQACRCAGARAACGPAGG